MSPKLAWTERLKRWRKGHEEEFAKALMTPPEHNTILKVIPYPGVVLLMGAKGTGKSALAHDVAEKFHNAKHAAAVLHLPHATKDIVKALGKLLPPWMKVTTSMAQWPNDCIVVYDEASQGAHARRTQSGDAVELDNLMGISRQRNQTIIFISHQSRKLDVSVIRDVDMIIWKQPTYAHWMFERNELTDFVLKGLDFFKGMTPKKALQTAMVMDFHHLRFWEITNGVPSYWSEELSHLFEKIKVAREGKEKKS